MKKIIFCTILSSLLTAMAYLVPLLGFFAFFSFAPMLYVIKELAKTKKQAFFSAFLFSFIYNILTVSWLTRLHPITNFDISIHLSFIAVYGAWILIAIYLAFFGAAALFLVYVINPPKKLFPLVCASVWIIAEYLMTFGELSFPMNRLASVLYEYPFLLKSASVFGSLFISFLMVLCSAYFALGFKNKKTYYIIPLLIFAINAIFCAALSKYSGEKIRVSAISEGGSHILKKQSANEVLDFFSENTKKASNENTDLVLWTETAIPRNYDNYPKYQKECKNLAKETGAVIVSGAFKTAENGGEYSAMIITEPSGKTDYYTKRRLVPFGEFIPFESLLTKIVPTLESNVTKAKKENGVRETSQGKIGGIICYDSVYPNTAKETVKSGAEILLMSANESWFFGSQGYLRHFSHSVLRAIENGRFLVRSANGGISAVISPEGEIVAEKYEKGLLCAQAELIEKNTPYTKYGDVIVYLAIIFCIYVTFFQKRVAKKEKKC